MGQRRREFRRTTIVSVGLLSFLLGLIAARHISLTAYWWLGVLLFMPLLFRRSILSMLSIIIIGLTLGCYRGSVFMQKLVPYRQLEKQSVVFDAYVMSDGIYEDKGQIGFDTGKIRIVQPYEINLPGTIRVKGFGEPMIYRGDKVRVRGKLYPTRGSRQASVGFAQVTRLYARESVINILRRRFAAGLQSAVPEPLGSLGLGILIGQRTTLPESLEEDMSVVGLTHIVAVSGYNMTILVQLAHRLVKRYSRYQATVLTVGFVGLFVVVTGSSASIIRAAIVSMLSIWAWHYGRTFRPTVLILLAAALTAGWFPVYVWSDLGWHLSFLAFVGVLLLAPYFQARFLSSNPRILLQLCIETMAAQIMTLPIILYAFGRLSLVALAANILVVPIIPLAMITSFIAGMTGFLMPQFAGWLAWPSVFILTYMVDCIAILAQIPHAQTTMFLAAWQMYCLYGIIGFTVVIWWQKVAKSGKVTDILVAPKTEPVVTIAKENKESYERT